MIRKLKRKVILLSAVSLFVLLAVIVTGMNILNYTAVVAEADEVLGLLSQNQGTFPGFFEAPGFGTFPVKPGRDDRLPHHMSPEVPYESRYFSVVVNGAGETVLTDVSRIASVDGAQAAAYGKQARRDAGFVGEFRYVRSAEADGHTRITFLDCGRKLGAFRTFLYSSMSMALIGYFMVFGVICFLAGRIVKPIAESYEKQKRFVTDAGHEMKTPLTIIGANAELLEMELGENESLADIRQQTKRLTVLTNDLVSLARMEEAETQLPKVPFPVSEVVSEAAEPYGNLFAQKQKALACRVQRMLTLTGNEQAIRQLVGILLDNALKYAAEPGQTVLTLEKQGGNLVLTVENPVSRAMTKEELGRIFDRFYRPDSARNSALGGHGIGLSMAKAIVTAHAGRISARCCDGLFCITAVLPL